VTTPLRRGRTAASCSYGLSVFSDSQQQNRTGFSMTITLLQKWISRAQPLDDSSKLVHAY